MDGKNMKKVKVFMVSIGLLAVVGFSISGCAKISRLASNAPKPAEIPKPEIFHDSKLNAGANIVRRPEFDKTFTAEIGANLYEKIYRIEYDTYNVISSEGNEFLRKFPVNNTNTICYLRNKAPGDPVIHTNCLFDLNNTGMFTHKIKDLSDLDTTDDMDEIETLFNPIRYTIKRTDPSYNSDSFRYVALYQGKIGNKIKVSFREFNQDMSRPAFTQDIEYELDKNGEAIVGFKGLRIKVMKATNTDITYSVIQDYN